MKTQYRRMFLLLLAFIYVDAEILDLSWGYSATGMSYWPGHTPYSRSVALHGKWNDVPWVASYNIKSGEHIGTHVDAPYHISKKGKTVDQLTFDELYGPVVVLNIEEKVKNDSNAVVTKEDILAWEAEHGPIPDRAWILMNSGWNQYWHDQLAYIGITEVDLNKGYDFSHLNWPGFGTSAAAYLIANRSSFLGLGVDTVSCDQAKTARFETHQLIQDIGKLCLENINSNISQLPASGAYMFASPIKFKGGSGGPTRLYAFIDEKPFFTERETPANMRQKMVDLSWSLSPTGMSYWPGHTPYNRTVALAGPVGEVPWVAAFNFATGEHIGTHVDAPFHFWEQGKTVDELNYEELTGPAVVINIEERVKNNPNAEVTKEDLLAWEDKNGPIPDNAWIIMNSGWHKYWGDQMKFIGTDIYDASKGYDLEPINWPGFGISAAEYLLANRSSFLGLASDSVSCEQAKTATFPVHELIQDVGKLCIENINSNITQLPAKGADLLVVPIKLIGGSGGPVRVYAFMTEAIPTTQPPVPLSAHKALLNLMVILAAVLLPMIVV